MFKKSSYPRKLLLYREVGDSGQTKMYTADGISQIIGTFSTKNIIATNNVKAKKKKKKKAQDGRRPQWSLLSISNLRWIKLAKKKFCNLLCNICSSNRKGEKIH